MIEQFNEDGFVRVDGLFSPDEVAVMRDAFDRVHALALELARADVRTVLHEGARINYAASDPPVVRHIAWVGALDERLDTVGRDPRLINLAAELLGSDTVQQLIHQAHYKRPGDEIAFDWHQDSRHRGMNSGIFTDLNGRGSYVQIAMALDDVTSDAGPLQFVRGSQRHRHVDVDGVPEKYIEPDAIVAPLLSAGDAVAFSPYVIHGSEANRSANWRRVFINGYASPGASAKEFTLKEEGRILRAG